MSIIQIEQDGGYATLRFQDRQMPSETGTFAETPWWYSGAGKDERVMDIVIGSEVLKLAQSDIRELLPYLARFAKTGKLM